MKKSLIILLLLTLALTRLFAGDPVFLIDETAVLERLPSVQNLVRKTEEKLKNSPINENNPKYQTLISLENELKALQQSGEKNEELQKKFSEYEKLAEELNAEQQKYVLQTENELSQALKPIRMGLRSTARTLVPANGWLLNLRPSPDLGPQILVAPKGKDLSARLCIQLGGNAENFPQTTFFSHSEFSSKMGLVYSQQVFSSLPTFSFFEDSLALYAQNWQLRMQKREQQKRAFPNNPSPETEESYQRYLQAWNAESQTLYADFELRYLQKQTAFQNQLETEFSHRMNQAVASQKLGWVFAAEPGSLIPIAFSIDPKLDWTPIFSRTQPVENQAIPEAELATVDFFAVFEEWTVWQQALKAQESLNGRVSEKIEWQYLAYEEELYKWVQTHPGESREAMQKPDHPMAKLGIQVESDVEKLMEYAANEEEKTVKMIRGKVEEALWPVAQNAGANLVLTQRMGENDIFVLNCPQNRDLTAEFQRVLFQN